MWPFFSVINYGLFNIAKDSCCILCLHPSDMNKEKVIYMEPKVLFEKQWKEKRHRTNRRRNFPWHTIAIVLGIVCFFLLLTTTVLGYTYFQSRGKNMECTKERNTSGTEPSVLQPFIDKDCGTCQGKWFCCGKDCYYFSKEEKSWDESAKLCRVLGSSLIKIDDQKEQLFIQSKINYNHWVGLRRKGANHPWKWQDGSLLSKNLNFQESTSDAKCGSLKSPNITPDICTREFHYICEKVFTCLNN
uniref:C-type lectin domain-containing protein n=1 Tax=Sus scrofa TaxID=9823 RepID=A0A8D1MXY4_PIG